MGSSADKTLRNLYLVAGVRGAYEPRSSRITETVEVDLLHALDHRWGITPPWGACDSGCDLESPGDDALRGWAHVDLRVADADAPPVDAPVAGLLRTMWDSLELFGTVTLTGVDADVPLACVGDRLWERVAGSVIRWDVDRSSDIPPRVLIQAATAYIKPGSLPERWDMGAIAEMLSEFVEVQDVMGAVPFASYPPSFAANPFGFGIETVHSSETDPFRAEVMLRAWTIDDAAWLVEAICASCRSAGVADDIQVAVRMAG